MKIRFFNAFILTMEERRNIFSGEIIVEDERITHVYEAGQARPTGQETGFDKEIDCQCNLLMPGFKNAHTHSGMTLFRSYADDLELFDWLHLKIFPAEAKMTGEDIYTLTKLAVLEYLSGGITAIGDMYLTPHMAAKACQEMGMRCVLAGTLNQYVQSLELLEECILKYRTGYPLLSFYPGIHAEYTCTKEMLCAVSDLAHRYQMPVFLHLSETKKEVQECLDRYGMTPLAFLDSLGMFDYGGVCHHCVHVTKEDIALMAQKKIHAVTNPASNLKLASGIAPVADFLKAGVPMAIGTDGPASNNCLDMFREMFLVAGLAKVREEDAAAVSTEAVLKMATVGGAAALGLTQADVLAEGKLADIIMLDLHQPNMRPRHRIKQNIVYSAGKQNVKMTMIHGRILYADGKFFIGEDPEDIYSKTEYIRKRLL